MCRSPGAFCANYQFFEVEGEFRPGAEELFCGPDRANKIKGAAPIRALSKSKLFEFFSQVAALCDSVRGGRLFLRSTEPDLFLAFASSPDTEHGHNARAWPWRRRRRPRRAPSRPHTSCGLVRASEPQARVDPRPSTKPLDLAGTPRCLGRPAASTFRFLSTAEGRLTVS